MADQHLEDLWRGIVDELLRLSEQASSSVPTLTPQQRAYLRLMKPVVLVDGYALLSAPHQAAKNVVEESLAPHITALLSSHTGQPYNLAVSVSAPEPEPEPAPEPPQQQAPSWAPTQSVAGEYDVDRPAAGEQIPMGLDELARMHAAQVEGRRREASAHPTVDRRIPREKPAHDPDREASLNPKYTFENFVIGSSNRFANGAAVAVAENPARAYNPLFIWGGSGLGKTHLLHAAGNYARVLQPGLRIKYVSSEEFTNDYINSVRDDRQESFKRRYRNLDILMVDDIQFLEGKEGTQEEFFHTFNALHQANKQIILSSDRPPKQLTTLEDRLLSLIHI